MARIIINIDPVFINLDPGLCQMGEAVAAVSQVIAKGRISDGGRCFCYATTFNNGLVVTANRTDKGTDVFNVYLEESEQR